MSCPSQPGHRISVIQRIVAREFGIDPLEMTSERRAHAVARPRQVAMALARELTPHSLPVIGRHFGKRDHTTVLHAIDVVTKAREDDVLFAGLYAQLRGSCAFALLRSRGAAGERVPDALCLANTSEDALSRALAPLADRLRDCAEADAARFIRGLNALTIEMLGPDGAGPDGIGVEGAE